jgi:hypothetical protein
MIRFFITLGIGFIMGTLYGVIVTAGDPTGSVAKIAQLIKALF